MTDIALLRDVIKSTDKAILIDTGDRTVWVPISLTEIVDGVVRCKLWFAKKNGIGVYGYRPCYVG